jgi:hypothetical protein
MVASIGAIGAAACMDADDTPGATPESAAIGGGAVVLPAGELATVPAPPALELPAADGDGLAALSSIAGLHAAIHAAKHTKPG